MMCRYFVLAAIIILTANNPLLAQSAIAQQSPLIPERPELPSPLPDNPTIQPPTLPTFPLIPASLQGFRVERFTFKGNTVIKTEELEQVTAPYVGKQITFSEVRQIASEITKFYNSKGYITSGAFLPIAENENLNPNAANLTIEIVEGKLQEIRIISGSRLHKYIRARLPSTEEVVNEKRLLYALRLLQQDPLLESITAEIDRGPFVDRDILNLRVQERQPFTIVAGLDNSRSPALGSFQRRVEVTNTNLTGNGDKLSISYQNTDGSNSVIASYAIPINPQNSTIEFSYLNSSANIIEQPFNNLDALSDASIYSLAFRQPVFRSATAKSVQEFALRVELSRLESESSLLGTPYPLTAGADDQGKTRITALRFSQEFIKRKTTESLLLRSQFSLGIDAFNATADSSNFLIWRGQAGWVKQLSNDATLVTRAEVQLADRPVSALEQISIGGPTSVRGYREATFLSGSGILSSTELRLQAWNKDDQRIYFIPFFNIATAWNNEDNISDTPTTGTLASVGVGLQYRSDRLNVRLDWGIPLIKVDTNFEEKTWQENGVYFSIDYRLF